MTGFYMKRNTGFKWVKGGLELQTTYKQDQLPNPMNHKA